MFEIYIIIIRIVIIKHEDVELPPKSRCSAVIQVPYSYTLRLFVPWKAWVEFVIERHLPVCGLSHPSPGLCIKNVDSIGDDIQ